MEIWVQSWRPGNNAFCDLSNPCLSSIAPATKKWGQVIRSAAPVMQNHLRKPEDLMLQMQPLSGNLRPDLLTHLAHVSLVLRLPREMHLSRSSSNVPHLPAFLKLLLVTKPSHFAHFWQGAVIPCACHAKRHPNVQKCSVPPHFFCTFGFEMCFAPQRRALFRHVNFQKCPKTVSF